MRERLRLVKIIFKGSKEWNLALFNPNKTHDDGSPLEYPITIMRSDEIYRMDEIEKIEQICSLEEAQMIAATYGE